MTELTLAEVLFEGADYMEHHGWTQEDYGDEQGRVCMLGACVAALGYNPLTFSENDYQVNPLFFQAAEVLRDELDIRDADGISAVEAVGQWNDDHCPDQQYAVDLLRATAEAVSR